MDEMNFRLASIAALSFAAAAFAQIPEHHLKPGIALARYPPLAEQGRIQGDVYLRIDSGVVTVVSGHPLLAPAAVENAKIWSPFIIGKLAVTYHFGFVDTDIISVPKWTQVRRGNKFERAILLT